MKERVKECHDCKRWGSMDCPNSGKCYDLADKPYFVPREQKAGLIQRITWRLFKSKTRQE